MATKGTRSREDIQREMQRLKAMYEKLPPEKQKVHRGHIQARLNDLADTMNGKGGGKGGDATAGLQTVLLVVLAAVAALAAGFFAVTYLAQG